MSNPFNPGKYATLFQQIIEGTAARGEEGISVPFPTLKAAESFRFKYYSFINSLQKRCDVIQSSAILKNDKSAIREFGIWRNYIDTSAPITARILGPNGEKSTQIPKNASPVFVSFIHVDQTEEAKRIAEIVAAQLPPGLMPLEAKMPEPLHPKPLTAEERKERAKHADEDAKLEGFVGGGIDNMKPIPSYDELYTDFGKANMKERASVSSEKKSTIEKVMTEDEYQAYLETGKYPSDLEKRLAARGITMEAAGITSPEEIEKYIKEKEEKVIAEEKARSAYPTQPVDGGEK